MNMKTNNYVKPKPIIMKETATKISYFQEIKEKRVSDLLSFIKTKSDVKALGEYITSEAPSEDRYLGMWRLALLMLNDKSISDKTVIKITEDVIDVDILELAIMLIRNQNELGRLHELYEQREAPNFTMMDLMNTRSADLDTLNRVDINKLVFKHQKIAIDVLYLPFSMIEFAYNYDSYDLKVYILDKIARLHQGIDIFKQNEPAVLKFINDFCCELSDPQFKEISLKMI